MTYREIPLPCGAVAIVDAADYPHVAPYRWSRSGGRDSGGGHVGSRTGGAFISLHRLILADILSLDPSLEVDHRDGDPLNNRRANLRAMTHGDHRRRHIAMAPPRSRHGWKGVWWNADRQRWEARIRYHQQMKLGAFPAEQLEDALAARDNAAYALFGAEAWLNRPERFGLPPHPERGQ